MSTDQPAKYFAGGFLYNPEASEVLLHQRDSKAKVNPNTWAFFGGLNEEQDKKPIDCFLRELHEELGIVLNPSDVYPLCDYLNEELQTYRYVFYVVSKLPKTAMVLGEGAGFDWIPLKHVFEYALTEKTDRDLKLFLQKIGGT